MKSGARLLAVALLFLGLLLLNYLASALPVRCDATAQKIYTLSPGTRALLAKIREPVELDFYFSRSAATLGIQVKDYADRVLEMLRQYARASRGRVVVNVIDPKPDTPEEEKATAAGISQQVWPYTNQRFYLGLVAIQADQQKVIPAFTENREQLLEYDLSQIIFQVQLLDRPKLGLLTSLPLKGRMDFMALQSGRPPSNQLVYDEWSKTYDLVEIEPSATTLPAGLDVLAIIHPQRLSRQLAYAIDQFLLAGKPVFLALDPSSRYFRMRGNQAMMMGGPGPEVSSDLPDLLPAWGIVWHPEEVVGDPDGALSFESSPGTIASVPVWINLTRSDLNASAPPTSDLESLWLIEPGAFSLKEGTGLTLTPLIKSSAASGDLPVPVLSMTPPESLGRELKPSGAKILAALIEGRFKSAFPDGPPAEPPAPPVPGEAKPAAAPAPAASAPAAAGGAPPVSTAAAAATAAPPARPAGPPEPPPLKESRTKSTLLLVGDTDWLFDDYSAKRYQFLGVSAAEPLNDNLDFATNAIDFLSGSSDLVSIRGKGTSAHPFTVVHDMEVKARQKYQEQLAALESRLDQVQRQLSQLEGRKTEGGRLIATPEMAKAIDDYRQQQVTLRTERRAIRQSLREGIEALENRLLLLNLATPPFLVAAFGLWFYRRRRRP